MGFLTGKRALIVGLLSDRSIAYGIAEAMRREGAEIAVTYVGGDRFKERITELAASVGSTLVYDMDVTSDEQVAATFADLKAQWGHLDILVHSVAFAPREALAGRYTDVTSREAFRVAHEISSYSLTALARAAKPLMEGRAGAIVTLSYLGAVRSIPGYNVMGVAKASLESTVRFLAADLGPEGIRVNAISAGPIKTLAASGIAGFRKMLGHVAAANPIRRNVTQEDV
ncbi:MAG: enoyl-ACP reductase, partial [Proteobacteria bacterium]|nr:enoyl-ACP reductase [Pseudomonadota bacterium]